MEVSLYSGVVVCLFNVNFFKFIYFLFVHLNEYFLLFFQYYLSFGSFSGVS